MAVNSQNRAFGVFSEPVKAEEALKELKASGFPMDKVSVIGKDAQEIQQASGAQKSEQVGDQNVQSPTAVVADLATGSTWGTILVGLSSLALPGVGPVLAAGSLGVALVTNLAGIGLGTAATNNLVKALSEHGIPEEQATIYSDRLLRGDYLVIVDGAGDDIRRAEEVFNKRGIENWGVFNSPNS